jgi:hypothetical protein
MRRLITLCAFKFIIHEGIHMNMSACFGFGDVCKHLLYDFAAFFVFLRGLMQLTRKMIRPKRNHRKRVDNIDPVNYFLEMSCGMVS